MVQQNEGEQMFYVYKDFRRTNQDKPMLLREFEGIIDIACGEKHAVAIDNRCQIWTWGWGTDHRLGRSLACVADLVDTFTPTIVRSACLARSVAAGYGHTLVLDLEGHLWAVSPPLPPLFSSLRLTKDQEHGRLTRKSCTALSGVIANADRQGTPRTGTGLCTGPSQSSSKISEILPPP